MSIYAPERNGSGSGFDQNIDHLDFQVSDGGGSKPKGHEPYPVQHLVGKVGIEGIIAVAETNLDNGHSLSQTEAELLRYIEEDFLDEAYDAR